MLIVFMPEQVLYTYYVCMCVYICMYVRMHVCVRARADLSIYHSPGVSLRLSLSHAVGGRGGRGDKVAVGGRGGRRDRKW